MVDVQSVGAGGGSIAQVSQGVLQVGPRSAGAVPGPACYGRGGHHATVTDADAVLGYLPTTGFAAGRMRLDVEAARDAIERDVARPLGMDVVRAAWSMERIVNAYMADATRRVLSEHGADPRTLPLIAYGGNGGVHAWAIAAELGLSRYLVPRSAPGLSALGVLIADYRIDLLKAYVAPVRSVDPSRICALMREACEETQRDLVVPAGLPDDRVVLETFVQMSYPGQSFDLSVPCPEGETLGSESLAALAGRFHDVHESARGFAFREQEPIVRGMRLVGRGRTPKPLRAAELGDTTTAADACTGRRDVYFGGGFVSVPLYAGPRLSARIEIEGPAVIEESFTAVVLPPRHRARLDDLGNYDVTILQE